MELTGKQTKAVALYRGGGIYIADRTHLFVYKTLVTPAVARTAFCTGTSGSCSAAGPVVPAGQRLTPSHFGGEQPVAEGARAP
jgi:hypothetical protein